MTPVALQALQGGKGVLQPGRKLGQPGIAQVVGAQRGQQVQADIGRRSAVRHRLTWGFLVMVGRQPAIARANELLKKQPGAAGQQAELPALGLIWPGCSAPDRLADPVGDGR